MKKEEQSINKTMDELHESIDKDWNKLKLDFKTMSKEDKKKLQQRLDLKVANLSMLREKRYGNQIRIRSYRDPTLQTEEEKQNLYNLIGLE